MRTIIPTISARDCGPCRFHLIRKYTISGMDRRSVASVVANGDDGRPEDDGYIEFLRFLQSRTPGKDDNEKCGPDLEGESRETSDDDSELDLTTSLQEDETDDDSMYIGPGEIGFYYSESIHESDISETDSEYEEFNEDVNHSIDTLGSTGSVIDKEEPQTEPAYSIEDARSLSAHICNNDDGYNEFLQFLSAPAVALSVKDAERGSFDDEVSGSVDNGYKEFLLFLRQVEHIETEAAHDYAKSPSPVNHLEERKVDDVCVKSYGLEKPDEPEFEEVQVISHRPCKLVEDTGIQEVYSHSSNPEKVTKQIEMEGGCVDSPISTIYFVNDCEVSKAEVLQSQYTGKSSKGTAIYKDNAQAPISIMHCVENDVTSLSRVNPFVKSELKEGYLQPVRPNFCSGDSDISKRSLQSRSPKSSLDDFQSCRNGEESIQLLRRNTPIEGIESADASEQPARPIIALERFSHGVSEESESQLVMLSKHQLTAFILGMLLFAIVFRVCHYKIDTDSYEIAIWFHLMAPFMLNLSKVFIGTLQGSSSPDGPCKVQKNQ
ncbi:LOW QUALITY PROTEIN: hypothetical protein HJC23_011372 [Cyclotella cryptica]|uniref:Uncharacterized protein n=1 Tax=Cyclotella cryptica TaxID=29204 RepID=A0ABD3PQM3_9STRA